MKRTLLVATAALAVYVGSYLAYRVSHTEVWEKDGRPYVIFGSRLSYYAFRPLSYLDSAATDIGMHIGPHQP